MQILVITPIIVEIKNNTYKDSLVLKKSENQEHQPLKKAVNNSVLPRPSLCLIYGTKKAPINAPTPTRPKRIPI